MFVLKKLRETRDNLVDFLGEEFYLILVIFIAASLAVIFYIFWTSGYILKQCGDSEIYRYDQYLKKRSRSFQDFVPSELRDFFPGANPVLTIHFLIPFFPLIGNYKFLIVVQMIVVGSSIVTFYLLSREYLSNHAAFLAALIYTTSPFIIYTSFMKGFKPAFMAFPFIPLIFYAYKRKNFKIFLFSAAFLSLTKQYFMLIMVLLGVYIYLKDRDLKYSIPPFLIGLLTLSIYVICLFKFPVLNNPLRFNYGYTFMGVFNDPVGVASRVIENLPGMLNIFSYNLFLPFLSPGILFIALPKIWDAIMPAHFVKFSDEAMLLIPFLYIATVKSLDRIRNLIQKYVSKRMGKAIIILLLISMIGVNFFSLFEEIRPKMNRNRGYPSINCGCCEFSPSSYRERHEAVLNIVEQIPQENSSVLASGQVRFFLVEEDIGLTDNKNRATHIIYDDCIQNCSENYGCIDAYKIDLEKETTNFEKIDERQNFVLLERLEEN